jgi:hypothetical protein
LLGIPNVVARAIEKPNWNNETDWVIDFANKCQAEKADIKRCLGFTITPEMPPTQVLGMVLAAYGFKTSSRRSGTGDRERVYSIAPESLEAIKALLAARAEKHTSKGLQPRPHPLTRLLLEGVAVGEEIPRLRVVPTPGAHQKTPIEHQSPPKQVRAIA